MSRVAQSIILNDTDAKVLSSIINGSIPASDDTIKRAGMILLLNQGLAGKDVAGQLDVREIPYPI